MTPLFPSLFPIPPQTHMEKHAPMLLFSPFCCAFNLKKCHQAQTKLRFFSDKKPASHPTQPCKNRDFLAGKKVDLEATRKSDDFLGDCNHCVIFPTCVAELFHFSFCSLLSAPPSFSPLSSFSSSISHFFSNFISRYLLSYSLFLAFFCSNFS